MTYIVQGVRNHDIVEMLVIRERDQTTDEDIVKIKSEIETFLVSKSERWHVNDFGKKGFSIWRKDELRFYLMPGDAIYWTPVDRGFYKIPSDHLDRHWTGIGEPFKPHEDDPIMRLSRIERKVGELADTAKRKKSGHD